MLDLQIAKNDVWGIDLPLVDNDVKIGGFFQPGVYFNFHLNAGPIEKVIDRITLSI